MFPTAQSSGFPGRLPSLPDIHHLGTVQLFDIGGGGGFLSGGGIGSTGGGIGAPGGSGGINIGMPPFPVGGSGGSGSGGGSTSVGFGTSLLSGGLSSVLGLPAINWGRIAAFLLGLLLIAGGIYLIKPVQKVVNTTVRTTARQARDAAIASASA